MNLSSEQNSAYCVLGYKDVPYRCRIAVWFGKVWKVLSLKQASKTGQFGGEIDKAGYLQNKLVPSCKNLKEVQLPPSGARTCENLRSQKLRPAANKRRWGV